MSNFPSKEDTLKKFRNNETLNALLKEVKDEKHKRVIAGVAEHFLSNFYDAISSAATSVKTNPEAYDKMVEDLKSRVIIVDSNRSVEKPDAEK